MIEQKLYRVHASVWGSKYLGEVMASSKKEAEEKAWGLDSACVCLCHQCSDEVEDPEIEKVEAYLVEEGDRDE